MVLHGQVKQTWQCGLKLSFAQRGRCWLSRFWTTTEAVSVNYPGTTVTDEDARIRPGRGFAYE